MTQAAHRPFLLPDTPGLWRGDALGGADKPGLPTGHAALDCELPGQGWPVGALTEILQDRPEAHLWQLLLPALATLVAQRGASSARVALIGAPHEPFGPALAAGGLPLEALLWVRAEAPAARLWACEQALRCADVAAVLAWLPQVRVGELRRLQLAAARHEGLLFAFRPACAAQGASPARLRLQVTAAAAGAEQIEVQILKRRGPPLATPLSLPARSPRMAALLSAAQWRRRIRAAEADVGAPPARSGATVVRLDLRRAATGMGAEDRALEGAGSGTAAVEPRGVVAQGLAPEAARPTHLERHHALARPALVG